MTITQQLDDLRQWHTEIPVVIAPGTQLPLDANGCFESLCLSRHAEQHLGPDRFKAVAPAQSVGDLHQTIQGLGKGIGHRILASRLLDLAADKFHEHGCNDMDPEAFEDLEPQEIKELVDGFNAWRRGETGETCGDSDDPKWACGEIGDDMWMAYLSAVIGREEANQ